ncbi:7-cyano-7-deazaguanine synthase [Candidatus Parcubacteria bacterium]|nr:MAG: 7-cyano-7-deazaguanine synthase [Candidatus Parcubacteria bacterium]
MDNKKYIALVSGGMDSTTLLYEYKHLIRAALYIDYASKHKEKEHAFAELHAKKNGIEFIKANLQDVAQYLKSNLIKNQGDIPDGHYTDLIMRKTVVPFRNGIMISIAAGIAESLEAKGVLLANHAGDHAIYPDCRNEFISKMAAAICSGTYAKIELIAPYTNITKRDIALKGMKLHIPYELTWSCYKGKDIHCGTCGTCVERKEALAGFDTTQYQA